MFEYILLIVFFNMKYSFLAFDYNFNIRNNFLTKFLANDEYTENIREADFIFIGSFVHEWHLNNIKELNCIKILYITEPIQFMNEYRSNQLYCENMIDILLGCVENDHAKMFKFPLWYEMKGPLLFQENVFIFDNMNKYVVECDVLNKRFCCLVNNHDAGGTRTPIYNHLKDFGFIECPSKLLNNCSNEEINSFGHGNNSEYFKLFKFVICSENFLVTIPGYITEKLVSACFGGAIPIYCGFFGETEEKIFNKERILFYDPRNEESLENVKKRVEFLLNHPDEFVNFYKQPVFKETAYETVRTFDVNMYSMIKTIHNMVKTQKDKM